MLVFFEHRLPHQSAFTDVAKLDLIKGGELSRSRCRGPSGTPGELSHTWIAALQQHLLLWKLLLVSNERNEAPASGPGVAGGSHNVAKPTIIFLI